MFEEIGGDKNFGEVFQVPETGSKAISRRDVRRISTSGESLKEIHADRIDSTIAFVKKLAALGFFAA